MSFPIQACSNCADQTENGYCPTCRRRLARAEIKVFWNEDSWTQFRVTVRDFRDFSSSLPHEETRLLMFDDLPEEEERQAGRLGLLVGVVGLVLVCCVIIALVLSRMSQQPGEVPDLAVPNMTEPELADAGNVPSLRSRKKRPTPRIRRKRPRPSAGFSEAVCGVPPGAAPAPVESVSGAPPQPLSQPPEALCGAQPPQDQTTPEEDISAVFQ